MKIIYTNNKISDKIHEIIQRILDKDIYLKELDFSPYSPGGYNGRLKSVFNLKRLKGIRGSM